jgi:hypothetical protein
MPPPQQPPGRFYARSTRPYPKRLKSPDYPSDWEPRRVYDKGSFDFRSQKRLHIGEALAGETIALAPSPLERYLEIYFGHVRIAYLDTKHLRVIAQIPKNALHEKEHQEAKKGPRNTSGTSKNCKPCSRSET